MSELILRNGDRMPAMGLGFWKVADEACPRVLRAALETGYRHLDGASDYGNEAALGRAIEQGLADGICRREELWVTSKLWNTFHAPEHVRPALERTLEDLRLERLDLFLIHFPIALKFVDFAKRYPPGWFHDPEAAQPKMEFSRVPLHETWAAMEEVHAAGLVRHIGVSNYNTGLLLDLMSYARVLPSVVQAEAHPLLTQEKLLRFCRDNGIAFTAFSPFGASSYVELGMAKPEESLLERGPLKAAAAAHGKSAAQVALRWAIQRGTSVVPKSTSPAHLAENLDVFDFELTEAEMAAISGLDEGKRYNDPGVFAELAFNTFCPIYD